MSDPSTLNVTYGRRTVKRVFTYPVTVKTLEDERLVREWLMKAPFNWRCLNITSPPGGGWTLHLTYSETIADTDRGEKVSYDRRWEVAGG